MFLKRKILSSVLLAAILMISCISFVACGGEGESETVKVNVRIVDPADSALSLCNLEDFEVTGTNLTVAAATQQACDQISLYLNIDDHGYVSCIGDYVTKETPTEAVDTEEEVTEPVEGEEETTEAEDVYYWELSVNGSIAKELSGEIELKEGDKIVWTWTKYVPETR